MAVYFECITRSTLGRRELFDLARSIDVHKESMARSREKAVAGVTTGHIGMGEEVTWRGWHFGLPLRMTTRITEFIPPDYFADEQIKGPFRRFRHEHEFTDDAARSAGTARASH